MKQFFRFLMLAGLVTLLAVSCSKDDDDNGGMPDSASDYVCFTGVSGTVEISMIAEPWSVYDGQNGDPDPSFVKLQYSLDAKNWSELIINQTKVPVAAGEKVWFKAAPDATHTAFCDMDASCRVFVHYAIDTQDDGKVDVSGDIMTLLGNAQVSASEKACMGAMAFSRLFEKCQWLRSAESLRLTVTELSEACYMMMFSDCTSLEEAPALPATTLAMYCYGGMFSGCTSLEEAPALPATTLAMKCYNGMFSGCTSLEEAPALPATTLAPICYGAMFYDCLRLEEAPVLPATILADYCYNSMFENCDNLSEVTMLATDVSASECLTDWLKNAGTNADGARILTVAEAAYADPAVKAAIEAASPDWTLAY